MRRHIDPAWEISVQDVKDRLDAGQSLLLVDVRQPEEHEHCRIEKSLLFPLPRLQSAVEEIRQLAQGQSVITYCHHGHRSVQAAAMLREAGIGRVMSMAGGIDAWSTEIDSSVPRY